MKPQPNARVHHSWQAQVAVKRRSGLEPVRLETGEVLLLGSAADCDVVLADASLPPVHCYVVARPEGVTVGWLGFEPVPTIDGEPFGRQSLRGVHRLRLGAFELRLEVSRAAQIAPAIQLLPIPSPSAEQQVRALLAEIRATFETSTAIPVKQPPLRVIGRDGITTKPKPRLKFAGNYGPSKFRRA